MRLARFYHLHYFICNIEMLIKNNYAFEIETSVSHTKILVQALKIRQRSGFLNSQYMTDDGRWSAEAKALIAET